MFMHCNCSINAVLMQCNAARPTNCTASCPISDYSICSHTNTICTLQYTQWSNDKAAICITLFCICITKARNVFYMPHMLCRSSGHTSAPCLQGIYVFSISRAKTKWAKAHDLVSGQSPTCIASLPASTQANSLYSNLPPRGAHAVQVIMAS